MAEGDEFAIGGDDDDADSSMVTPHSCVPTLCIEGHKVTDFKPRPAENPGDHWMRRQ